MNYLAHLYLSGNNDNLLIGNFIADAVKGRQIEAFSPEIKQGIYLHRAIDAFTDTHPLVKTSATRLAKKYHKYSTVIVDMFYDHFLATHWNHFSIIDLRDFIEFSYSVLIRNFNTLPGRSKRILPAMIIQNWLENYGEMKGLQRSFEGMARRAKFDSGMDKVITDLEKDYELYREEFMAFFPDMIEYVNLTHLTNLHIHEYQHAKIG